MNRQNPYTPTIEKLLDENDQLINENNQLKAENEQLRKTLQELIDMFEPEPGTYTSSRIYQAQKLLRP